MRNDCRVEYSFLSTVQQFSEVRAAYSIGRDQEEDSRRTATGEYAIVGEGILDSLKIRCKLSEYRMMMMI